MLCFMHLPFGLASACKVYSAVVSEVCELLRLHDFCLSNDALSVAGTRQATTVFTVYGVHVAILQVLGVLVPDGIGLHERLSKGGGAFLQGAHNVAGDWLASCQVGIAG